MSGLLDGNLFESMRLILPEHRVTQKSVERELSKQSKPVLSEDQYEEMQTTIVEAIENGSLVKLTLFGEYGNKTIVGHPIAGNGRLRLCIDEGTESVPLDKLIGVESI